MKITGIYDAHTVNKDVVDHITVATDENDGNGYNMMLSATDTGLAGWGAGVVGNHLGKQISINDLSRSVASDILKAVYWRLEQ